MRPDGGTVQFLGKPLDLDASALRREAGYVSGDLCYYPRKRLSQLTAVTKSFYPSWDDKKYEALLHRFSLDETKRVCELSAGMKVKYQLACALSHGAKLLILDEPTSGLDPVSRDDLLDLLRTLCEKDGVSILFSTHITTDLDACADDVTYLQNGAVAASCPLSEFTAPWKRLTGPEASLTPELRKTLRGLRAPLRQIRGALSKRACLSFGMPGRSGGSAERDGVFRAGGGGAMTLFKKEWKLVMMPVPLLFLLLSGLVLIPNYPYYVTFFYTTLGIFLMMQSARENRDLYYMALLPVTKCEMVKARFSLVLTIEAMQVLACVPFLLLRASYGEVKNAVGMEANIAFLGFSLVLLGLFNRIFFPMHYKNAYDLGKPFVISSITLALGMVILETLQHVLPYLKDVCDSYEAADQLRQLPVLLGGLLIFALLTCRSFSVSVRRFENADL